MNLPTGTINTPPRDDNSYFSNSRFVKELTPADFDDRYSYRLSPSINGCAIVLFYAPWCPHCKALSSPIGDRGGKLGVWEQLGETVAFYNVYAMNCEKYRDQCEKIKRERDDLIQGFPSIVIYNRREPKKRYEGERTVEKLVSTIIKACGK